MELEGIEPSSAKRLTSLLRPFPSLRLAVDALPGQLPCGTGSSFRAVSGLCLRSAVSPAVHHYFCCRAVVIRPRVPLLVAMSLET